MGQALVEFAFLMVLLATITFGVIALAGSQLSNLYQEASFEFTHMLDNNTYTADGTAVAPGAAPAMTCGSGESLQLRGHKWKCKKN